MSKQIDQASIHIKPSEPVNFLSEAYSNYLAARILLNQKMLLEGHILAHYCLEKYIKGLMLIKGLRLHGHELATGKILNPLREYFPNLSVWLTLDFLKYMHNAFQLRYWDNQKRIGNIVLFWRKTLYHLDKTVVEIESKMLKRPPVVKSAFQLDLERKSASLYEGNLALPPVMDLKGAKYEEDMVSYSLNEQYQLISITATLSNHPYDVGFIAPGHLKFVPNDSDGETIVIPSRTYEQVRGI